MAERVDFGAVKRAALASLESLVTQWLPDGKREGTEWSARNPKRADAHLGSFKCNLVSGAWKEFATGDAGGDPISLYAYLHDCSQLEAARAIGELLGVSTVPGPVGGASGAGRVRTAPVTPTVSTGPPAEVVGEPPAPTDEWVPIVPVPSDAPAPPAVHSRHGRPSRRWAYRDARGAVLCWVYRFDAKKGKTISPLTYCAHGDERAWRWKALPTPRPLYQLDELARRPDAAVVVCEGEKAADAAQTLLPQWVATTSLNGASAAKAADWSSLVGRRVIVWPDYDEPGRAFLQDVAKRLQGIAASLEQVRVPLAGTPQPAGLIDPQSREPEEGWDAADAAAEGWTAAHLARVLDAGALLGPLAPVRRGAGTHGALVMPEQLHRPGERAAALERDASGRHPDTGQPWPPILGGWVVSNDGVQEPGKEGSPGGLIAMRPVWVESCTYQTTGNRTSWGVYLKFYDMAWKLRAHAIPMRRLSEQGGILGQELLDMGLPVIAGKEKMLSRYLGVQATQAPHVRATSKLGWIDDDSDGPRVFVMPDQVIGDAETIIYQPDAPNLEYLAGTLHARGTLDEWRAEVAGRCTGNPVLMFFLLAGLAPPLMRFTETPSGGFHLAGGSTTGKTTALQVAVTPWGCGADPQSGPQHTAIRRWKATGNALEAVAEMHNHMLLALDEISEVDPRELGGIIYQLAGGQSKGRATIHGGLRALRHWQLFYVSSGERSISDILRMAGHVLQGGQQVRLPEIPAEDPTTGRAAVIESTAGAEPRAYAEALKHACARYYGTAGPVFVAYLIGQVAKRGVHAFVGQLREELREFESALVGRLQGLGERLSDENRRALRQFALVLLAGAHAREAGILRWSVADVYAAGEAVVLRWVRDQGTERTEVERGLAKLRDAMIARRSSFVAWDVSPDKVQQREVIGFTRADWFMVLPAAMGQLVGDHDVQALARALAERGYLEHNAGRLTKRAPCLSALGDARPPLYWINQRFLEDVASDDDEPARPARPTGPQTAPLPLGDDDDVPY